MMPAVTNTEAANQEKIVQPSLAGAVPHGVAPEVGAATSRLLINTLPAASFQARELASTLDERGWSSSGPPRCGCMDTTSGEKLGNHPSEKLYGFGAGIIFGPSEWARIGIYRSGVSLHRSRQGRVYACPSVLAFALLMIQVRPTPKAFAARLGGAYYVDDAEIGKPGSCGVLKS